MDQAFERLNGHTPMGIYRGGKVQQHLRNPERIPFIVRWPAKVKPNKLRLSSHKSISLPHLPLY